jgi:ATP adenylyltransferase
MRERVRIYINMISKTNQAGPIIRELLGTLKGRVREGFHNNQAIVYIKSSEHTVKDQEIEFNVKIMESLNSKPSGGESKPKKEFNPFLPPFEEGLYIADVLDKHRLLYNKFSVCDEHVLVTTKDFEEQTSLLTK